MGFWRLTGFYRPIPGIARSEAAERRSNLERDVARLLRRPKNKELLPQKASTAQWRTLNIDPTIAMILKIED